MQNMQIVIWEKQAWKYLPFFSGRGDLSVDSAALTFEDSGELSDSPETLCSRCTHIIIKRIIVHTLC